MTSGHDVMDVGDVRDDSTVPYMTGPDGERDFNRVLQYSERVAAAVASTLRQARLCDRAACAHKWIFL